MAAGSGVDRSVAAFLLSQLSFAGVLDRGRWQVIVAHLIEWLPNMDGSEVYGIRRLIMHLRGNQSDLYDDVRNSLPAAELASMFSASGTRESAEGWADLLRELAPDYGAEIAPVWRAAFEDGANVHAMKTWLANTTSESRNDEITALVDVLAEIAPTIASHALRACAPHLSGSLESNMADAVHGFSQWAFGTMGLVAHVAPAVGYLEVRRSRNHSGETESNNDELADLLDENPLEDESGRRWEPSQELQNLAAVTLEVMQEVDWSAAAASLNGQSRHELEGLGTFLAWLGWLSAESLDRWADAISFEWLDQLVQGAPGYWSERAKQGQAASGASAPVTTVEPIAAILVEMAGGDRANERARAYLMNRLPSLQRLPFGLIDELPDVAVAFVRGGGRLELENPRGGGWVSNARTLHAESMRQLLNRF